MSAARAAEEKTGGALTERARLAEQQLQDARAFYKKKVRALEESLDGERRRGDRLEQAALTREPARRPKAKPPANVERAPPADDRGRAGPQDESGAHLAACHLAVMAGEVAAVERTLSDQQARHEGLERQWASMDRSLRAVAAIVEQLARDVSAMGVTVEATASIGASLAESPAALLQHLAQRVTVAEGENQVQLAMQLAAGRARQAADVEVLLLRQECTQAIRAKNLELRGFREELDTLISGLTALAPTQRASESRSRA